VNNNHPISEEILLQMIELINCQFEELGNYIADSLLLIELYNTSFGGNLVYSLQVQESLNKSAEEGDDILNRHKTEIINELKDYMSRVLADIRN
jgi:hypothetical protein